MNGWVWTHVIDLEPEAACDPGYLVLLLFAFSCETLLYCRVVWGEGLRELGHLARLFYHNTIMSVLWEEILEEESAPDGP